MRHNMKANNLCFLILVLTFAGLFNLLNCVYAIDSNNHDYVNNNTPQIGLTNDSLKDYYVAQHSGVYIGKGVMLEGSYYLTEDIMLSGIDIMIPKDKIVNLCLHGHEFQEYSNHIYIESGGTLNIYDCSVPSSGKISCSSFFAIQNEGVLNIHGGCITCTYNKTDICSAISNNANGVVSIYGGTLCSQSTNGGTAITISNGISTDLGAHVVNVFQGTIKAIATSGSAACISSNSIVNIEGGIFDSTGKGLNNVGTNAVMTVSGGIFSTVETGVFNNNGGSLTIEDGIIHTTGNNTVTCGVSNNACNSHFLMTGGQIIAEAGSGQYKYAYGIFNDNRGYDGVPGSCRIDGGIITAKAGDYDSVGIENRYGYVIINGGKIGSVVSGTGKSVGLNCASKGMGFVFGSDSSFSPIEISGMTAIIKNGSITANDEYRVIIGNNDYSVEESVSNGLYSSTKAKWVPYLPKLKLNINGDNVLLSLSGGKGTYFIIAAQYDNSGRMLDVYLEKVETPVNIKKDLPFDDIATSSFYRAFLLYDTFIPTGISSYIIK